MAGKHDASMDEIRTFVQRSCRCAQMLPATSNAQSFNKISQPKLTTLAPRNTNTQTQPNRNLTDNAVTVVSIFTNGRSAGNDSGKIPKQNLQTKTRNTQLSPPKQKETTQNTTLILYAKLVARWDIQFETVTTGKQPNQPTGMIPILNNQRMRTNNSGEISARPTIEATTQTNCPTPSINETEVSDEIDRHNDVVDPKKPCHPPQSCTNARTNNRLPSTTQTQLLTENHTGWQSHEPTFTTETMNFVVIRHSTDKYTIRPKTRRERPETNHMTNEPEDGRPLEPRLADDNPKQPNENKSSKVQGCEIRQLSATLQLNKRDRMLFLPLHFRAYENFGLLDTGAIESALSDPNFDACSQSTLRHSFKNFNVQIANGNIVPVRKEVLLRSFIGGKVFGGTFVVLPTMDNVLIGMSFFKKYSVTLDLTTNIGKFPDITLQLRSFTMNSKNKLLELKTTQKLVIQPNQQVFVPVVIAVRSWNFHRNNRMSTCIRETITHPILVSPVLSETKKGRTHVQVTNPLDYQITINVGTATASSRIMTPKQANNLQPMTSHQRALISQYPDSTEAVRNQIFHIQQPNTRGGGIPPLRHAMTRQISTR